MSTLKADIYREQILKVEVELTPEQEAAYEVADRFSRLDLVQEWAMAAAEGEWFEAETLSTNIESHSVVSPSDETSHPADGVTRGEKA